RRARPDLVERARPHPHRSHRLGVELGIGVAVKHPTSTLAYAATSYATQTSTCVAVKPVVAALPSAGSRLTRTTAASTESRARRAHSAPPKPLPRYRSPAATSR